MAEWEVRATQVARLCLQTLDIPEGDLETELVSVSRKLAVQISCIGGSAGANALTGDDAAFWGEGVGYLFAAAIRKLIPKGEATGELVRFKIADREYQYAPPAGDNATTLEADWLETGWESIACISSVAAQFAAARAGISMFLAAGPSRAQERQGSIQSGNPLFNALQSLWRTEGVAIYSEAGWRTWQGN